MSKIWLNIIGINEGEQLNLSSLALIKNAKNIIGAKRLINRVEIGENQNKILWNRPYQNMIDIILSLKNQPTIILATGDVNYFGIGASISKYLKPDEYMTYPALSAFQLAASKMHWAMQNIDCISLHGRPTENLNKYLSPKNRILALTSNADTLIEVVSILKQRNYEKSNLSVLENLGSKNERIISFEASEASEQKIGNFYVLSIDCIADINAPILPIIAGLPDEAYSNDGQLTKREVRAITLSKLAPYPNALLWDIGAGSGSIGIEFMRLARGASAICFEKNKSRIKNIEQNALNLGVPDMKIIAGDALDNIKNQPSPEAIFIGGNVANEKLFDICFKALKIGGRMVVNAVTIAGEMSLLQRHKKLGGELIKIDIKRAEQVGNMQIFVPKKTITQWLYIKGQK